MKSKAIWIGIVSFFLIVSSWFAAHMPATPMHHIVGQIAVVVFLIPSGYFLVKWLGILRGFGLLGIIGLFALAIETIGLATGFPYGQFVYGNNLGFKLFGLTPWTVFFAWTPLVLAAFWLGRRSFSRSKVIWFVAGIFFLVGFDIVLDPGAVALGYWSWLGAEFLYGVPLSNFLGWAFSGLIGMSLICLCLHFFDVSARTIPFGVALSGFFSIVYWTAVAVWFELWISVSVGLVVLFLMIHSSYMTWHNNRQHL